MENLDVLTILTRANCPYCEKVKAFVDSNNLSQQVFFISKEDNADIYNDLREKFNVETVPFAFRNDKEIYNDSSLIISYLRDLTFNEL